MSTFPDWEGMEEKWSRYASDVFKAGKILDGDQADDEDEDVDQHPRKIVKKGKKKAQVSLQTLDSGIPQLPNILDMHVLEKQDIIRAFVTCHYCN